MFACNSVRLSLKSIKGNLLTYFILIAISVLLTTGNSDDLEVRVPDG